MPERKEPIKGEIQRPSPVRALSPFEEFDRIFESLVPREWIRPLRWDMPTLGLETRRPNVDVIDRENEVLLCAEVPGARKEDLDISVDDHSVTLKGTISETGEKGDFYRCEISRGAFSRTVALPFEIDSEKVKAVFNNGILELTLPKKEKSRRHSVKIQ